MKEELYEARLAACAKEICENKKIRWVMIAGGSCSGKTTTTHKLASLIRQNGRPVEMLSLDDYYRNPENAVYLPNGKQDIEGLQSLRLDLLAQTMRDLNAGKKTSIPFFDFKSKHRFDGHREIDPDPNGVILVEGLHALNPAICAEGTAPESVYRIYLYADPGDGTDGRFLRRLVRDHRYRAADAAYTFAAWDDVRNAEKDTIEPFIALADQQINTYFDYEHRILADNAVSVLKGLPAENVHAEQAKEMIAVLETVEPLPDGMIPEHSLLREFI